MRKDFVPLVTAALCLSKAAMAQTLPPPPSCFSNTTNLFEHIEAASPFVQKTYVLCPNTVFNIGFDDDNGNCCERGDFTIFLKSKTTIKCGEDGSSNNNCTIRGGEFQMFNGPQIFDELIMQDCLIQGLTFAESAAHALILGNRGDITFKDCIFKDQVNRAPILVFYTPRSRRKLFEEFPNAMDRARYFMQKGVINEWIKESVEEGKKLIEQGHRALRRMSQSVTFDGCLFENIRQGDTSVGLGQEGIIGILTPTNPVTVVNCTFANNIYDGNDPDSKPNGHAITTVAPLEIRDTCMINNRFTGFGPVQAYMGAEVQAGNNFATFDDNVYCQFVAKSDLFNPESESNITCIEPDLTSCSNDIDVGPLIPIVDNVPRGTDGAPTMAPAESPTGPTSAASHQRRPAWLMISSLVLIIPFFLIKL